VELVIHNKTFTFNMGYYYGPPQLPYSQSVLTH